MGYRDELDALRAHTETLAAELKQCQSELTASRERARQLEADLEARTVRVAELEIASGGELGCEAQRQIERKRKLVAGSLMLLVALAVGAATWTQQRLAQSERGLEEARQQQQRAEATAAAAQADNARLEMVNAELQNQLRALAERRARRGVRP